MRAAPRPSTPRPRLAALAIATVALVAVASAPLHAQDDEKPEKKERDPEVAAKLDEFKDAIRAKGERDQDAVGMIDELLRKQAAGMHERDELDFVKSLDQALKIKPVRKPEQPELYRAAVVALGEVGTSVAAQVLATQVEKKPFKEDEWLALQEDMYEAIGKTKDPRQVKFLLNAATRDPIDGVKRAAGKALRHYADADLAERKEIFKTLQINYAKVESDANSSLDPGDTNVATGKRTLAAIADGWNTTLAALSGQNYRTAEEWQHWWNKNKNDDKAWK